MSISSLVPLQPSALSGRTLALAIECPASGLSRDGAAIAGGCTPAPAFGLSRDGAAIAGGCTPAPAFGSIPGVTPILSEILLRFSPRISSRTDESAQIWFFLDVSSNSSWIERTFGDDVQLVEAVLKTLSSIHQVKSNIKIAVADTPQAAQAFAMQYGYWISGIGRTKTDLDLLPLSALLQLEGLQSWRHTSRVEEIANFFSLLGLRVLGDLNSFTESTFHERWGELGAKVHRRLQGVAAIDPQPIEPFVPLSRLKTYVHLDYPISIISLLLHETESAMKTLFARLEGRRLVARRLRVCLRCEYSNHEHVFTIEPSTPTREIRFFKLLLENRLERIELLNPIKDLELEVDPLPENERQEDFHDQARADQTKLELLTSLLTQEGAKAGFAELQDDVWPENTWISGLFHGSSASAGGCTSAPASGLSREAQGEFDETGFAPKFEYAATLPQAPRPALLLRQPRAMSSHEVSQLQIYSGNPTERIEHSWWEGRAGPPGTPTNGVRRDYYIARDRHGRNLWIFQDRQSDGLSRGSSASAGGCTSAPASNFFLHGAFD